ncbi:hypothetical protein [Thalassospira sp.]|uniref:hypothetical protein n=1 Tax=Thalassospira sp. TaxID=1912094 RepID=UPI000C5A1A4E|nr:hypothetical protein [Thalassospira sp.]MBC07246.1 hypothetical protein [Thalassospira sp.]|tara:strand:- start:6871 stop:7455 length:585 start_codon:yes stop_codon:yes gene_type:complete
MADEDNKTNEDPEAEGSDQDEAQGSGDAKSASGEAGGGDASGKDASASEKSEDASSQDDANGSPSGSDPAAPDNPPGTPPLSTALNPQIVQAVGTTNHAVLNGAIPGANGVAYQKVAQAAAYAVQDSTDYMRNIMSMATATTGVAMQKMLAENKPDPYDKIIEAATKAVADAQKTFTSVGQAASGVVKDFDNLA